MGSEENNFEWWWILNNTKLRPIRREIKEKWGCRWRDIPDVLPSGYSEYDFSIVKSIISRILDFKIEWENYVLYAPIINPGSNFIRYRLNKYMYKVECDQGTEIWNYNS